MSILFPIILKRKKKTFKRNQIEVDLLYIQKGKERVKDVNKILLLKIKLYFDVNLKYYKQNWPYNMCMYIISLYQEDHY